MKLIADGGSTKTSWCLTDNADQTVFFQTEGYHPFFVDSEYISKSLKENLPEDILSVASQVASIYFYSAGGGYSQKTDNVLVEGLKTVFPEAKVVIETDLLAAARALLQHEAGFAGILGTGTNTCIYDGEKVTHNIESLGFLLGDEGSGSYIGKKIIGDYIRGYMPAGVKKQFEEYCPMTIEELFDQLYTKPMANKFCAKFSKFAGDHLHNHEYYYNVVYNSFDDLFKNIVIHYPGYKNYSFNCVGSVAYYFQPILKKVAENHGMKTGAIYKEPMDGLVKFHTNG